MEFVQLKNIVKEYELGRVRVHALRGVSLSIGEGEFTAIAGPSGSGKSTLLNIIGCMDVPSSGTLDIAGKSLTSLNESERTSFRLRNLGFIFQSFNLMAALTVEQNVELPLLMRGGFTKEDRQGRVEAAIKSVGLADQVHKRPSELSGGQQQRVAIARALVTTPKIVLADEPTANLDSVTGDAILDLMLQMNEKNGTTFVFSTHDKRLMDRARRCVMVRDGTIGDDRH